MKKEIKNKIEELKQRNENPYISAYEKQFDCEKGKQESKCLHELCTACNGTGQRIDGMGACTHGISCPCSKHSVMF